MSIQRINIGTHKSDVVVANGFVFVSGITAKDRNADVRGQTREILSTIEGLIRQAGTDKSKIVSANIWLQDVSHYTAINEIWNAWLTPGHPPVRACVGATLAIPGLLIEIAMVLLQ